MRWFETCEPSRSGPTKHLRMCRLRWARQRKGRVWRSDFYDVVRVRRILYPVFVMPDPTAEHHFFYNHFVAPYNVT